MYYDVKAWNYIQWREYELHFSSKEKWLWVIINPDAMKFYKCHHFYHNFVVLLKYQPKELSMNNCRKMEVFDMQTLIRLFRLVQNSLDLSKIDQICPKWFKLFQTCSKLYLFKSLQTISRCYGQLEAEKWKSLMCRPWQKECFISLLTGPCLLLAGK